LFSQTKTTGASWAPAKLTDSWNEPAPVAPSPKNATPTSFARRTFALSPKPTAWGTPPPVMPLLQQNPAGR
jgi:hypothetical protein